MKNDYEIRGDVTVIFLLSPKYGVKETLINTEDLERAKEMPYIWLPFWNKGNKDFYVTGNIYNQDGKRTQIYLHRWILMLTDSKQQVDHINHQTLDNTRSNLNIVTHAENQQNKRLFKNNTSGYQGISWNKKDKRWQVLISVEGKRKFVGNFINLNDAIIARKKAEQTYYKYKQKIAQ